MGTARTIKPGMAPNVSPTPMPDTPRATNISHRCVCSIATRTMTAAKISEPTGSSARGPKRRSRPGTKRLVTKLPMAWGTWTSPATVIDWPKP